MNNPTPLILVALSLVACGGEPFGADSADIEQIGGADSTVAGADTGDAGAGYGGTASGGSSSTAGKPAAGAAPGGSASAGGQPTAGTGGATPSCEFDEAKLTAALPMSFVWGDFMYTSGEFCGRCLNTPCAALDVISWGVPTIDDGGAYVYSPNVEATMVAMALGANDGTCASEKSCGAKMRFGSVRFIVARSAGGWVVETVTAYSQGEGNACLDSYPGGGSLHSVAAQDLAKEIETALDSLEIPCD